MKDLGLPSLKARGFPSSPSVGREGSDRVFNEDAQESPVSSTRGTETGEAIPTLVLMVGGTVVNASSTTQHFVTLSASEAEYVAMAQGANTASFTKAVLDFLQPYFASETIDLFEDNQGAIAIAENPISGGRTKHIDVRCHFVRELVERKVLNIPYTESSNQHADILTKPLGLEAFARHRSFLMNLPE